ncbi:hypothetical protein Flavo103_28160 [Flavobacterium collinsii]|nr:hypothetical protein Flavo103_28160 [Flavobacterium collinsii]
MTTVNSYLAFNGNCLKVKTFCRKCLKGQIILQAIGESPGCLTSRQIKISNKYKDLFN